MMKVSEFLNNDMPPLLLGAFFGKWVFSADSKTIFTYSYYKIGSLNRDTSLLNKSLINYPDQLNNFSGKYRFWKLTNSKIVFELENDLNLDSKKFYCLLYTKLLNIPELNDSKINEDKKMFIRGFVEPRCSIDKTRNLIALDYNYETKLEMNRIRFLIDNLGIPTCMANYNFREFQPEYKLGKKRATQFRLNAEWYGSYIGFINDYKSAIFENHLKYSFKRTENNIKYFANTTLLTKSITFEERLSYYAQNVHGKKLTSIDAAAFKKLINRSSDASATVKRSADLVDYIRYCTEDKCNCCCDEYDISQRSHINPSTNRYYFEIHHVISLGGTQELDDVDNLVKLCPACHRALKRGSASEQVQKQLIRKILKHNPNVLEFCNDFFDETDFEKIVHFIWTNLK